jgi:serine phosphatase RsbU (regulator of sigma subunit)
LKLNLSIVPLFIPAPWRLSSFIMLLCIANALSSQNQIKDITQLLQRADSFADSSPSMSKKLSAEALRLAIKIKNDSLEFKSRFSKGIANYNLGNQNEALEDFIKNKELAIKLKNNVRLIESLNAIGNVYKDIDHYEQALHSFREAIAICRKIDNGQKLLMVESNIASVYNQLARYDSSNFYCFKVLRKITAAESKDYYFISNIYSNILSNFSDTESKDSVLKYTDTVLTLKKRIGDITGYAGTLFNLGIFYFHIRDFKMSEKYLRMAIASNPENIELRAEIKKQLASVTFELKKFEESANLYWEVLRLKDSIHVVQGIDKLSEMEVKYETGKKEEELKRMSVEKEVDDLRLKQSRFLLVVSIAGILLCAVVAYMLFRQNKNRKKANQLLKSQNAEILHQKNEITDSISYARRIQKAILPPDNMVERLLPSSFIFYKPKDVVSGDFYWVEEKNSLVMFAAVDCTGHGVPGAMMSVIGMNLLNQAVKEKGLIVPADILQHLDTGVTDTLRQSSGTESVKDGMDLSLCALNTKTLQLQFAGAFNNLWLVRKNIASSYIISSVNESFFENHLLEIKADKFPIGSNLDGVADTYTNHTIQLQEGDCIYLYSDGFADQFGGPKGKKFKYNALKKLLVSLHDLSPTQQKEKLSRAFTDWQGNLEQVDDILVIGVKI